MSGGEEPSLANWSTLPFLSIRMCPGTHTSWILLCSATFTKDWWESQTNLEFVCKVSSGLMAACIPLFYFLHYTRLNSIYFSLEYCGVACKTSCAPFSSPICIPDQSSFAVCVEHILPFTPARELHCEWLVICTSL
jgi:hypothetical protein